MATPRDSHGFLSTVSSQLSGVASYFAASYYIVLMVVIVPGSVVGHGGALFHANSMVSSGPGVPRLSCWLLGCLMF